MPGLHSILQRTFGQTNQIDALLYGLTIISPYTKDVDYSGEPNNRRLFVFAEILRVA